MRELTGRHVLMIFGGGFGVIIAVNLTLAYFAVRTFPGLEVRNSYVASQVFDEEREAQEALGWDTTATHEDGLLTLAFADASGPVRPEIVSAVVGRATHVADDVHPDLAWTGDAYAADLALAPGIWAMRFVARADDGTLYRRRLEIRVQP